MSRSQSGRGSTVDALASYLEMGGYGAYVWPAYSAAAVVLIGLVAASLRTLRAREAALKALEGDVDDAGPRADRPA